MKRLLVTLAALVGLAGPSSAQPERYELGRRLRAFEAAWEERTDASDRKRALPILPKVTTQFFSFQFGEAGRTLDEARFALQSKDSPSDATKWLTALSARPTSRLVNADVKVLKVEVLPFYKVAGQPPAGAKVTLRLGAGPLVPVPLDKFPVTVEVPFDENTLGDTDLTLNIAVGEDRVRLDSMTIARVAHLTKRIEFLREAAKKNPGTTASATIKERIEQLTDLADGTAPETDFPISSLLRQAEKLAGIGDRAAVAVGGGGPPKGEQLWLTYALDKKKTVAVRMYVPPGLVAKKPVPLVVALHGAGGSENLFFDGYGAGRIVTECEKRGWLLVATRSGLNFSGTPPVTEVVGKMAETYPVDRSRLYLVGHSMGAGQVAELCQAFPGQFAGAAMLGGGGRVRKPEAFATLPTFVGVGDQDFALAGAKSLKASIEKAGAKTLTYKEYPGLEHLVIVREALPDVFAMFDRVAKK